MDTQAMKGRALAALTAGLGLLVVVIFLISAGKHPVLLGLVTLVLLGYAVKMLWRLGRQKTKE